MKVGCSETQFLQGRMMSVLHRETTVGLGIEELEKLRTTQAGSQVSSADLQAYLAEKDTDGDGRLGPREITPSERFGAETLHAMLDELAHDHSRAPGQITVSDLRTMQGARRQALDDLDLNKDGGLTADELAPLRGVGADPTNDAAVLAALDWDGDGKLNLLELSGSKLFTSQRLDALAGGSGEGPPQALAEKTLARSDADGDGRLSYEEFAALRGQSDGGMFKIADKDRDGGVSAAELADMLDGPTLGLVVRKLVGPTAKRAVLAGVDTDGDKAFSAGEITAATGQKDAGAILGSLDTDHDGRFSMAELDAAVGDDPEFFRSGRISVRWEGETGYAINPDAAHVALSRLMWKTLDRMTDQLAGKPATDLKA